MKPPFDSVNDAPISWARTKTKIYAIIRVGVYEISVQHSPQHYCTDTTAEIAIFHDGKRVQDFNTFDSTFLQDLFAMDSIAGWVTEETLAQVITELEKISP